MANTITGDQVVEAAKELSQDEFTRADLADKLGVEKPELKQAFKSARKSGRVKKVRDDEQNTGHFRLTDK
jgi:DNA-binding transcriptional regulator LsrR (DeoR family)